MIVQTKKRRCAVCKKVFTKQSGTQSVCSYPCAIKKAEQKADARRRKEHFLDKKKLREGDIKWWHRVTTRDFNKWIRYRDMHRPCISCGAVTAQQWDAGHYRPAGNNGSLRYEELNVHKQCSHCNQHKSANLTNYRIGLIKKIGLEKVEWLESERKPKKWVIEELRDIREEYRSRLKDAGVL